MDEELTWAGGLDLGLVLFGVRVEKVWGRVLTALYLALEGVQTLDVLFLERAGGAARRAHVQVGGQLPPLLVLVHLVGDTGRRRLRELRTQQPDRDHSAGCFHQRSPQQAGEMRAYLCEAANLFDGHVEAEEI